MFFKRIAARSKQIDCFFKPKCSDNTSLSLKDQFKIKNLNPNYNIKFFYTDQGSININLMRFPGKTVKDTQEIVKFGFATV